MDIIIIIIIIIIIMIIIIIIIIIIIVIIIIFKTFKAQISISIYFNAPNPCYVQLTAVKKVSADQYHMTVSQAQV